MTFTKLFLKEMRSLRMNFVIFLAIIFVLDVFLITRVSTWGFWNVVLVSLTPLLLLIFLGMLQAFLLVRDEWKAGTAPFLRSLPVSGWGIVGAKMLAAFAIWIVMSLVVLALSGIIYASAPLFDMEWLPLADLPWARISTSIVIFGLGIMAAVLFGGIVLQSAFLLGRIVNRFSGLLSDVAAGIALMFLTSRVGDWLVEVLSFFPVIRFEALIITSQGLTLMPQELSTAAILVLILELGLLFWVAGWLMEKKAES